MKKTYNDTTIKTLDAREHVRLRVGNYTGGTLNPNHTLKEIFYNAQDEHEIGNGNYIKITYNLKENIISVKDMAQGFPVGVLREDGKTVFQAAIDTLNTSGKFSDEVYNNVTGLNGQGLKITNFLSKFLDAYTTNSTGKAEHIIFKDGIFESREYEKVAKSEHGTTIKWQPDPQFFQSSQLDIPELKQLFKECSALHPNLTIDLEIDGELETYSSKNGLNDLLDSYIKDREILKKRFVVSKSTKDDSNRIDVALTYTSDYSEKLIAYVNAALTESGTHITCMRTLITQTLNKYARNNKILKEKESNISGSELSEGMVLIFNLKADGVSYTGQAKEKVSEIDTSLISSVMSNEFYDWLSDNPKCAKTIIDKALLARRAKEAAQKAKDAARGLKAVKKDRFLDLPNKLIDANPRDHDRSKCTLYLVEGDSASSGIVSKRDGERHGIMPLRGKILSVRKATVQDMYKNQEISNIVKSLGLDVNTEAYTLVYNLKKLRYHKIVLLEDGDCDGGAIRMLLITLLWRLCPELVINGHVYSSRPPLFKVIDSKNNYSFCTDKKALEKFKSAHKKEKLIINRLKGLGEMSPDELYECMIKDGNDNIMQITVEDIEEADKTLEIFMGTDTTERRSYYNSHYNISVGE